MNNNERLGKRIVENVYIYLIILILFSTITFAVPNSINIQGKLTDSNNKIQSGEFNFTFRIYDNFTSGNKLYETNITATTDGRGIYDVILNNIDVSFDRQLYLGAVVNNGDEMTPRGNLTAAPYAFRANTSEDLDKSKSYTVAGFNITGNLTLVEKITFGFGEIIDNIVDGWLRITGNLNVTGNIDAVGTITADTLKAVTQLEVGGGFDNGGLTIEQDGDIITQGDILFSGNVTFINVSHLSVNGSVNPSLDGIFDVGSASLRWRNANFSGTVEAGTSLTVNGTRVCLEDGTNCQSAANVSIGFFTNFTSVKTTGNITNGTLNGYLAANEICNLEYSGTHMCQIHEVLNTINDNRSLAGIGGTFRVSEGAPGFTANANDCNGWKSADGSALGSVWVGDTTDGGSGSLVACNAQRFIGCCS